MELIRKSLTALVILFAHLSLTAQVVGGELTYKCLDASGNYEVKLILYRNCSGPVMCAGSNCSSMSACGKTVDVYGNDPAYINTKFTSISLSGVSVRDVVFHDKCPDGNKSVCDNMGCITPGRIPGYERYEFVGTVNIGPSSSVPPACCNVRFTYNECCRASGYQNMNSANTNYYTDAVVNRCVTTFPKCHSPVFLNDPVFSITSGPIFNYNMGAMDADQDSLVYSFTPSLTGYNTPVTYINPFTFDQPMPFIQGSGGYPVGIKCDPSTGNIYFKPTTFPFIGAMAIRVDQYRTINNSPTLVGVVRRDLQLNVISGLTDNPPTFSTPGFNFANQPKTTWEICSGSTLCFDIIANDTDFLPPNVSDTTYLSWDKALEAYGATFLPSYTGPRDSAGPRLDHYTFCWTPPDSIANQSNGQVFTFTVTAEDNQCPYASFSTKQFRIFVYQKADITIKKEQPDCNRARLSYVKNPDITPVQQFTSVQWKIAKEPNDWTFAQGSNIFSNMATTPNILFGKAGDYFVELSISMAGPNATTCPRVFYDTIHIRQALPLVTTSDTIFCRTAKNITIKAVQSDTLLSKFFWYSLPDTTSILVTNKQFTVNPSKSVSYLLRAYDTASGCQYSDTTTIYVGALKAAFTVNSASQCIGGNQFIMTNTTVDTAGNPLTYQWKLSTGDNATSTNYTRTFANAGNYTATLIARTSFGCTDSTQATLTVNASPIAQFSLTTDSAQCLKSNSYQFSNQSTAGGNGMLYNWTFGTITNSTLQVPPAVHFTTTGFQTIKLLVTSQSNACQDSMIRQVRVHPSPVSEFTLNAPAQCLNGNLFSFSNLSSISSGSISQVWYFGDGNAITFTNPSYVYATSGQFMVKLKITSNLGCLDSIEHPVTVYPTPHAAFTVNDSTICLNDTFYFQNTSTVASGNYTMIWDFKDGDVSTVANPVKWYALQGTYQVQLLLRSAPGECRDSVMHEMTVSERPATPVITGDTLAIRHSSKTYSVETHSGSTYQWTITGDSAHTTNANTAIVQWGPSAGGRVAVREMNGAGCFSDTAALLVRVVPKAGLGEFATNNHFQVYPNPAAGAFYISGNIRMLKLVELYSAEGKLIHTYDEGAMHSGYFDLHAIQSGFYWLLIRDRNDATQLIKMSVGGFN